MVLGYHCIFSTYGFWLPNDPRGSGSDWVRSLDLLLFGGATKVNTRHSLAHNPHDRAKREAAKAALRFPAVVLNGKQALAVAHGFARTISESHYVIHACAILPQHVHLVVARHERRIEQIVAHMKGRATQALKAEGLHPLAEFKDKDGEVPSPWAHDSGWIVYLNSARDVLDRIAYVEGNPLKEGKPRQRWSFVAPYVV